MNFETFPILLQTLLTGLGLGYALAWLHFSISSKSSKSS